MGFVKGFIQSVITKKSENEINELSEFLTDSVRKHELHYDTIIYKIGFVSPSHTSVFIDVKNDVIRSIDLFKDFFNTFEQCKGILFGFNDKGHPFLEVHIDKYKHTFFIVMINEKYLETVQQKQPFDISTIRKIMKCPKPRVRNKYSNMDYGVTYNWNPLVHEQFYKNPSSIEYSLDNCKTWKTVKGDLNNLPSNTHFRLKI